MQNPIGAPLLQIGAVIDFCHAEPDRLDERAIGDPAAAVEHQGNSGLFRIAASCARFRSHRPSSIIWTLPALTAKRSTLVCSTNRAACSGSVREEGEDDTGGVPLSLSALCFPTGKTPNSASTATPRGWRQRNDLGDPPDQIGVRGLFVGQHDHVESGLRGPLHRRVNCALVEHRRAGHPRRLGRRTGRRRTTPGGRRLAIGGARNSPLKPTTTGGTARLGSVDHAFQRGHVPGFKIAHSIADAAGHGPSIGRSAQATCGEGSGLGLFGVI